MMGTNHFRNSINMSVYTKVCRLCLEVEGELDSIFFNDDEDALIDKIYQCTTIKMIPANGIQSSICAHCKSKLNELYSFREQCIRSEDLFQSKVQELENETIIVVPDIFGVPNDDSNCQWEKQGNDSGGSNWDNDDAEEVRVNGEAFLIKISDSVDNSCDYNESNGYDHSHENGYDNRDQQSSQEAKNGPAADVDIKNATFYIKDKKFYQCSYCDKYFNQSGNLKAHINTHTGYKPFGCDLCERSFAQKSNLNYHMKSAHDPSKPFKCNCCEKCFNSMDAMVNHLKFKHGEVSNPLKSITSIPTTKSSATSVQNQKKHDCPFCGKSFSQSFNLKLHINTHTGTKPYICGVCGKAFAQKSNLNVHITKSHQIKPERYVIKYE